MYELVLASYQYYAMATKSYAARVGAIEIYAYEILEQRATHSAASGF